MKSEEKHACVTKAGRLSCQTCAEVVKLLEDYTQYIEEDSSIMMELVGRSSLGEEQNVSILGKKPEHEPQNSHWKRWLWYFGGFLFAVAITGGLIYGLSLPQTSLQDATAFPPVDWDQICSQKVMECPPSYEGHLSPLLLISMDGFRSDYIQRGLTPNLEKIRECGTDSPFMYSVFPTKTFPNHFSIVTGLYPSSHGIVDNTMYDSITGDKFKVGTPSILNSSWWQGEPIWVTAEKQGIKTGTFFWPGSDVKINDYYPSYFFHYNGSIPYESRIEQVLDWMDLAPSVRPRFMTLYMDEPDKSAHQFGIYSSQVNDSLVNVDKMLGRLLSGMQARKLLDCVNIIIVSDHGMADTDCTHSFNLENFIDVGGVNAVVGAFARLRVINTTESTDDIIAKLHCTNEHIRVYPKESLPIRMHYANNPRIEPVIVDIDVGWNVVMTKEEIEDSCPVRGIHGYDDIFPQMKGMFTAFGPSIRRNSTIKPFLNIELYELMCDLIDVRSNPNNGTRGSLYALLRHPPPLHPPSVPPSNPPVAEPATKSEKYQARLEASQCLCSQSHLQVPTNSSHQIEYHVPFGVPAHGHHLSPDVVLLSNKDYVLAFNTQLRTPSWGSFTLKAKDNFSSYVSEKECWTGDARVYENMTSVCYHPTILAKENVLQRPLFSPNFSDEDTKHEAYFITNSIAKSINHTKILEEKLYEVLYEWTVESNVLNVIMGPAFDIHATELRPSNQNLLEYAANHSHILVPTHVFVVATWCSEDVQQIKDCDASNLDVHSFLLPNEPYVQNCEPPVRVMEINAARLVDVEKLTGISFFPDVELNEAIRLKTSMPHRPVPP